MTIGPPSEMPGSQRVYSSSGYCTVLGFSRVGRLQAEGVAVVAVECVTREVGEDVAAEAVRPAARDDVDDAAGGAAVFGRVARRLDLDLFDEVGDQVLGRRALVEVGRLGAIDDPAVLRGTRAVDRDSARPGSLLAPGAWVTIELKSRPFGSFSNVSDEMFVLRALCLVSMMGDSAVTDTVSVTPPTASARSMVRIWPRRSSMFSVLAGVKPCSLASASYFPGAGRAHGRCRWRR